MEWYSRIGQYRTIMYLTQYLLCICTLRTACFSNWMASTVVGFAQRLLSSTCTILSCVLSPVLFCSTNLFPLQFPAFVCFLSLATPVTWFSSPPDHPLSEPCVYILTCSMPLCQMVCFVSPCVLGFLAFSAALVVFDLAKSINQGVSKLLACLVCPVLDCLTVH